MNTPTPPAESSSPVCTYVTKSNMRVLSDVSLALGFASIIVSVATWFFRSKQDPAHGERFGIFIGLWVPSFFMLSNRLARKADELP
jgi:hypothetical protein